MRAAATCKCRIASPEVITNYSQLSKWFNRELSHRSLYSSGDSSLTVTPLDHSCNIRSTAEVVMVCMYVLHNMLCDRYHKLLVIQFHAKYKDMKVSVLKRRIPN